MSSKLDIAVMDERMRPIESRAPSHLVRAGQTWASDAPHCYKCHYFEGNKHCAGMCKIGVISGQILSMDMGKGRACKTHYKPMWTARDGLTQSPPSTKD
ncbi:MAG: hypothetical protein JKX72_05840 [Robiginitomaculum sp.]|nr:hypothetical protein [Robiginitomaculum sp.]